MQQKRQAQQFNCHTRRFIFIRYPPSTSPKASGTWHKEKSPPFSL